MIDSVKYRFSTGWSVAAIPFVLLSIVPYCLCRIPGDRGGDASFMQALIYIFSNLKDYQFGTDVAFSYGPLAFLRLRLADSLAMVYSIFIFDVFIAVNILYFISRFFPLKNFFSFAILLITLYRTGKDYSEVIYFVIILFNCFQFLEKQKNIYLLNIIVISILSIFIKLNFALAQGILVFVFLIYLLVTDRLSIVKAATLLFIFAVSVFSLSLLLNVQLIEYFNNSLHVIAGYNDAMFLPISWREKRLYVAALVLIALSLILLARLIADYHNHDSVMRLMYVTAATFLLFKYGFVRSDHYHVFYQCIILIISLPVLYEQGSIQKWSKYLYGSVFVLSCIAMLSSPTFGKNEIKSLMNVSYFSQLVDPAPLLEIYHLKGGQHIPPPTKSKIGKSTVDVMDRELSLAFSNNLNYKPRPTLQSYCAYNHFLDTLNSNYFASEKAPEFILFTNSTIDDRCAIWDESITKRTLLLNYTVTDSFKLLDYQDVPVTYMLLEKNRSAKHFSIIDVQDAKLAFNQKYYPDTTSAIQFLYADVEYSLFGKIRSALFQPDHLNVFICYEDDKVWHWRGIPPILKTGVLINKMVTNSSQAYQYFASAGKDNLKVKWFYFASEKERSFKPDIKCTFKKMTINNL